MQGQKEFLIVGDHTFQVVDFVPFGYEIWNIGKNMPKDYLPLCRLSAYQPFPGGRNIEVDTLKAIKIKGAQLILDAIGYGALANASFWQHFPLKKCYPQKWIDREELEKRGLLTKAGNINYAGRNFIIFYVGDYDASSWLSQRMIDLWNHPDRGKEPLMWCVSPVLSERVPHVMHYIRSTASDNDYFASADNGAGYLMPGMLPANGQGWNIWRTSLLSYLTRRSWKRQLGRQSQDIRPSVWLRGFGRTERCSRCAATPPAGCRRICPMCSNIKGKPTRTSRI